LAAALGATSTSKGDTVLDHVLFLYPHSDAIHIFNAANKRRAENTGNELSMHDQTVTCIHFSLTFHVPQRTHRQQSM
jgi:hypothetical protein